MFRLPCQLEFLREQISALDIVRLAAEVAARHATSLLASRPPSTAAPHQCFKYIHSSMQPQPLKKLPLHAGYTQLLLPASWPQAPS